MISYHQRPCIDMHCQRGAPQPGFKAQSRSADRTSHYGLQLNVPHLPTILEWYLSSVSTMYISGLSQYPKSDRETLSRIQDLQLVVFVDLFREMHHQAIGIQMAYVLEHLLMPADDPELSWHVPKSLWPSSTCCGIILAKESSWIWLPPWTLLLPHKYPFGIAEHFDLHWPWVVEHSDLH